MVSEINNKKCAQQIFDSMEGLDFKKTRNRTYPHEWISIEDIFPEIGHQAAPYNWSKAVLCLDVDKVIHIAHLTDTGFWRSFTGKYCIPHELITHWMPLPDLPK